ncbi:hypothetical protein FACS1894141_5050 [Spirochaetia bacterium]|nr:hypothetical protein FACS1894141_5050 [Spirochaetia bacterium]
MKKLQVKGMLAVAAVLTLGLMFIGCSFDSTPVPIPPFMGTWENGVVDNTDKVIGGGTQARYTYQFQFNSFTAYEKALDDESDIIITKYTYSGDFTYEPTGDKEGTITFTTTDGKYKWTRTYDLTSGLKLTPISGGAYSAPGGTQFDKISDLIKGSGALSFTKQ